jgi:hypothetical protein
MTRRFKQSDWRMVVLVLAQAVAIAGFISADAPTPQAEQGGWRKVDREALMEKIRSGDLVQHEADWYRVVPDQTEKGDLGQGR